MTSPIFSTSGGPNTAEHVGDFLEIAWAQGGRREEAGDEGAAVRWVIDPIDGTKNFSRGVPIRATLIALEEAGDV
jgi:histidinol-phosphatase